MKAHEIALKTRFLSAAIPSRASLETCLARKPRLPLMIALVHTATSDFASASATQPSLA
jgi:hypothetical protein